MQSPDDMRKQARLTWLAEMYRAYAVDLQRYIYSKVGESFLAEDLTSTVFLKALRWLREEQSGESARGWLYATARTTIVDHWQSMGQYETRTLAGLEDLFSSQLEIVEAAQQQAELRVQHLLSLLPERERRVLNLRFLQGYSAAEIAAALGTNAGHIWVLQLRALRHAAQLESQERNVYTMQEQGTPCESFVKFLSPESLRVLELSREEALNLKHAFIGTEHLLWGISLLQVRTALAPPVASQACSFCGRTGALVKHFFPAEASVGGSTPSTCICDRCVEQFHALLQQT